MYDLERHRGAVIGFAALFSLLLSYWSFVKETVINSDAICYLQSAETMKIGLHAAMHLCDQAKWPLFSGLIYSISSLTHFSTLHVAYGLDAVFSLISVLTFIGIVHFFKVSWRILALAALVILLAHEFNAVRVYVIRDHGYWAFYLLSVFFLLHYFRYARWCFAFAWGFCLIIATLFRIEGAVFLGLLPWVVWFDRRYLARTRFKMFLQLNVLLLAAIVLLVVFMALHPETSIGRVDEVKLQMMNGLQMAAQKFSLSANALTEHVLSVFAKGDAKLILVLMLFSWYIYLVAANLSFVYMALIIYAWYKKLLPAEKNARLVLWAYVLINIFITSIFLVENMFLSKRYLLALSLILMVWVPFALDDLIKQRVQKKWLLMLAVIFIFVSAVGGIFDFGHSKKYIRTAGDWLAQNTPVDAAVYSNDYQVMYYSQHFGNEIFTKSRVFLDLNILQNERWKQFDYVALRSDAKNAITLPLTPVQVFQNKRGDKVSIYKISH